LKASFISHQELQGALLELLTFLATSARGAVDEPKLYGPLRLIETAQRVINLMDRLNLSDDELNAIADRFIDEAMSISIDEARCVAFTDEMAVLFARRLRDV
jgi:hypothetical protein